MPHHTEAADMGEQLNALLKVQLLLRIMILQMRHHFPGPRIPQVNDSCFFKKLTAWNQYREYRRPWFLRAILSCLANYCFQMLKCQSLHFYMKGHLRSRATLVPGKAPVELHHGSHSPPALLFPLLRHRCWSQRVLIKLLAWESPF